MWDPSVIFLSQDDVLPSNPRILNNFLGGGSGVNIPSPRAAGVVFREEMPAAVWIQREQQRAPTNRSEESTYYREEGNRLFSIGRFAEATHFYTLAIQADRMNAVNYTNRSFAHYRQREYTRSAEDAQNAALLRPDFLKAHYRLGIALLALGNCTAAEESLRRCLELSPTPQDNEAIQAGLRECSERSAQMPKLLPPKPTTGEALQFLPALDFGKLEDVLKNVVERRRFLTAFKESEEDERRIMECKDHGARVRNLIGVATSANFAVLSKEAEESKEALRRSLKTQDARLCYTSCDQRDTAHKRLWDAARCVSAALTELHRIAEDEREFFSRYDPLDASEAKANATADSAPPEETLDSILQRRKIIRKNLNSLGGTLAATDEAGRNFLHALKEEQKALQDCQTLLEENACFNEKLRQHGIYIARHATRELSESRLVALESVRAVVHRVLSDAEAFEASNKKGKELLEQEAKLESRRLLLERQRIHIQGEMEWLKVCDEPEAKVNSTQSRLEVVRSRLSELSAEQAAIQEKLFALIEGDHPEFALLSNTSGSRILRLVKGSGLWVNLSLSDFEIVSTVSSTANSKVYHARRRGGHMAIKEVSVETESAKRRFQTEVNIVAMLNHPNIIRINGVFFDGPFAYLMMPFYPQGSLKTLVEAAEVLSWVSVQDILRQLASGMAYLHERGIVHADVKPSNVLLSDDNNPIITDFGIAKNQGNIGERTDVTVTLTGAAAAGTVNFMAPEQLSGAHPSAKSDIWSLGLTFYLFVAKNAARQNPEIRDVGLPIIMANSPRIEVPLNLTDGNDQLSNLISSMLVVDAEKRASAHDVLSHPYFSISLLKLMGANTQLIRSDEKLAAVHAFTYTLHGTQRQLLLSVSRNEMVESVHNIFKTCGEEAICRPLLVVFQGEEGVDQGALTTEMLNLFYVQLVRKQKALVCCVDKNGEAADGIMIGDVSYLPVPDDQNTFLDEYFETTGMVLVKNIVEQRPLPLQLNLALFKYFCGLEPSMMDLQAFDNTLAQNLKRLRLLSSEDLLGSDLDFSDFSEEFLESQHYGAYRKNTKVTTSNVELYIQMRVQYELIGKRKRAMNMLKKGFFACETLNHHLHLLSPTELALLLCGCQHLTARVIIDTLDFQGFSSSSNTPQHLREVLMEYSQNNLRRFLQLCTALATVPENGFSRKIKVLRTSDTSRLPVGHGCVFQLDLPDYNDKTMLSEKMGIALSHVTDGFHIV